MTRISVDYDRFAVVTVPFPLTDRAQTKRRPALVISSQDAQGRQTGHGVLAMITSARNPRWPLDVPISDLDAAGLPAPSVVRMKLFTLDCRFIIARRGHLSEKDGTAVAHAIKTVLGL
ncbi:MAG: type II toxin-antitoxin system PemK/MazF family toxin [Acidiferrobacterales bacterium]